MKPIAWYDPTNGAVSTDKDSPLFTPLGQMLPLYTKQEDDGITLTTIRHPRGKPALGDLNPESLEQVEIDFPEQEPVPENFIDALRFDVAMREWVGLTEEEIEALAKKHNGIFYDCDIEFAHAIEAKLKEKNT
jgi:hypothetical protein